MTDADRIRRFTQKLKMQGDITTEEATKYIRIFGPFHRKDTA